MKRKRLLSVVSALAMATALGTTYRGSFASDHDDGETDQKSRALNLTDHYAFKSGNELALIMYFNSRSLPGKQYFLSTGARYELHVSKAANRTAVPTGAEDYVFRIEAGAPNAAGVQTITLTVLQNGTVVGQVTSGTQTPFLKKAIGMAYVPVDMAAEGTEFEIDVRGRRAKARVVPMPFYKRPRS